MSLFIGNLSFSDPQLLEFSKMGILLGSLVSGALGYYILRLSPHYGAGIQQPFDVPEQSDMVSGEQTN